MAKQQTSFEPSLLTASADEALAALAQAQTQATALVEEWVRRGNAEAVQAVAEGGSGIHRKTARRGLSVLRSRGIRLPERKRVAQLGKKADETVEAWLLPPYPDGTVVIVIASHAPASRYHAGFFILDDTEGLKQVDYGELSQSQLKETFGRGLLPIQKPIPVSVAWARSRVIAARGHHDAKHPEPLGMGRAAFLLGEQEGLVEEHPFDQEGLELADDDARERAKACESLHGLSEFAHWMAPEEAVDELLLELGQHLTSGTEPEEQQLRDWLEEEVNAATDRFFLPERRDDLLRAMRDGALGVLQREGEQRALDVVAVMSCIRNAGLITDPPHEVEFLRVFFHKALSLRQARDGGNLRIPVPTLPTG